MLAPQGDVVEVITRADRPAAHQQQNLLERIHYPMRLPVIVNPGKFSQKQCQTRARHLIVKVMVQHAGSNESKPHRITFSQSMPNLVNLATPQNFLRGWNPV
jgi:hypothetical protein